MLRPYYATAGAYYASIMLNAFTYLIYASIIAACLLMPVAMQGGRLHPLPDSGGRVQFRWYLGVH